MDFYFVGADDLLFHDHWLEKALAAQRKTGGVRSSAQTTWGTPRTQRGWHSTHFLVSTEYLECGTVDEPGKLLHEGYSHEFTDDECIQTARMRRTYVHAFDSHVEHLHPDWGKGTRDATYEKAQAGRMQDQRLFEFRKHMWQMGRVA